MRLIPSLTVTLLSATLPTALAAPIACKPASPQQTLKSPFMTSYETKTKDRKIGNQVIKGRTTVSTTTIKSIPNGIQTDITSEGKTTVMKATCVNGKSIMTIDGKVVPTDFGNVSKDVQNTMDNMKDVASLDFSKRKVGEVWSGQLTSLKTEKVTSEATFKRKLVAVEKVTTPAGTFDTYKVEETVNVTMTYKDMPKDIKMPNMNSTTVTTTWYAKEAPHMIIKSESDGRSMTLLKYKK